MVEKEGLVSRVNKEMAFFKRELLNREENYNKKFNANPVVGVMQVGEREHIATWPTFPLSLLAPCQILNNLPMPPPPKGYQEPCR